MLDCVDAREASRDKAHYKVLAQGRGQGRGSVNPSSFLLFLGFSLGSPASDHEGRILEYRKEDVLLKLEPVSSWSQAACPFHLPGPRSEGLWERLCLVSPSLFYNLRFNLLPSLPALASPFHLPSTCPWVSTTERPYCLNSYLLPVVNIGAGSLSGNICLSHCLLRSSH